MDALMARLVRQPRRAGDVANGVEAGDIGRAVAIDDHMVAVELHAQGIEAQVLDIAGDPDRHDGLFGLQGLGLAVSFQGDGDAGLALG